MILLEIERLRAGYGDVQILRDVSFSVETGQIVALIGANGAGKTTTLRAISGLIPTRGGTIRFDGQAIHDWPSHRVVDAGLVQVPEGRHLFGHMTVQENLELGSIRRGRGRRRRSIDEVFSLFPRLGERRRQIAGTLSGGEQQMLAIGRALMAKPRLLLLDEPTEGLAPRYVGLLYGLIGDLQRQNHTILIVEQTVHHLLRIADRAYVLEHGHIIMEGQGLALLNDERLKVAYLGL